MSISRRTWRQEEDQALIQLIQRLGKKNWGAVAHALHHELGYKQRSGKQCRERWHNQLNPKIEKGRWTEPEQNLVFEMHSRFGNKWTGMAQQLPGRTDNAIKNFFYSTIRRSLRRISKLVGQKNSTIFVRNIKPITLSRIFASQSELFDMNEWPLNLKDGNLKKEEVKNICCFLKTEILAFTRISIGKSMKNNLQKMQFNKQKMLNVLKQIVIINKVFEDNQLDQEIAYEQSSGEQESVNYTVKSEEESIRYTCQLKKESTHKANIEKDNSIQRMALLTKIKEDNKLPFFPELQFSDINFKLNPILPYPFRMGPCPSMDFYYYSPMLYFQPKISNSQPYKLEDQNVESKTSFVEKNMLQNQKQNDRNKMELQNTPFTFSEGRLPSVKELIEGVNCSSEKKKIQLTADQYNKVVIDFMGVLDRRLREWRLN